MVLSVYKKLYVCLSVCLCVLVLPFFKIGILIHCLEDFINKYTKLLNLPNQTITTTTRGGGVKGGVQVK